MTSRPKWARMIGLEAPAWTDLGFAGPKKGEVLPFKAKDVCGCVDLKKVSDLDLDPTAAGAWKEARQWIEWGPRYAAIREWLKENPGTMGSTDMTLEQWNTLVRLRKFIQDERDPQAVAQAFTVTESKLSSEGELQWSERPIVAPMRVNEAVKALAFDVSVTFATMDEVREAAAASSHGVAFDLEAAFDQISLQEDIRPFFAVQAPEGVGKQWTLGVLPMGFSASVRVADALLQCLCPSIPELRARGVKAFRRVDNLVLLGDQLGVEWAAAEFQRRADSVGARYRLEGWANPTITFSGEEYDLSQRTHQCTQKTRLKLKRLLEQLAQLRKVVAPLKRVASWIGLMLFATEQVEVAPASHPIPGKCLARVAAQGGTSGWCGSIELCDEELRSLEAWAAAILGAAPVPWCPQPKHDTTVIYTDASCFGWGCCRVGGGTLTMFGGEWTVQERRRYRVELSCVSEPLAVIKSLCVLLAGGHVGDVVVFTDHMPLVWAMQARHRGWSGYGEVARFLQEVRPQGASGRTEFRFVPGVANPADAVSRGRYAPPLLPVTRVG